MIQRHDVIIFIGLSSMPRVGPSVGKIDIHKDKELQERKSAGFNKMGSRLVQNILVCGT